MTTNGFQIWDVEAEFRERSAIHEAGHAAYAWYFSARDHANPPFTSIHLDAKVNQSGCVYGCITPRWANLPDDILVKGAVILAGIFTQENCGRCSRHRWSDIINDRDSATGGVDDYVEARKIAEESQADWEQFLGDVLEQLQRPKGIRSQVRLLAKELMRSPDIAVSSLQIERILGGIPVRD